MKTMLFFLLFLATTVCAVDPNTTTLFASLTFPQGNFAAQSAESGGYAEMGFGGGLDYTMDIAETGLGWTTALTYISNLYGGDIFNKDVNLEVLDASAFDNFNIMTGLKYRFDFSDSFSLFMHARYGFNYCDPPSLDGYVLNKYDERFEGTLGFDTTSGSATNFGVGLNMNETFRLSLEYFNLGAHTFSSALGYQENSNVITKEINWDVEMTVLLLTFGYNIKF